VASDVDPDAPAKFTRIADIGLVGALRRYYGSRGGQFGHSVTSSQATDFICLFLCGIVREKIGQLCALSAKRHIAMPARAPAVHIRSLDQQVRRAYYPPFQSIWRT
jgi:hypothetical protein